ncbi:MAG: class I SAM-dependent methyltransferase [Bermanella sp.]
MNFQLELVCTSKLLLTRAQELAKRLNLVLRTSTSENSDLSLQLDDSGLSLLRPGDKSLGALKIDFNDGALTWRRNHGGGTGQAVAKAVGLKQKKNLSVLDATAGTGTDAFVLAALGCNVTLLERHPIVAALLEDALLRASLEPEVHAITEHMELHQGSSISFMENLPKDCFDVVFLDPMFPHTGKKAQVKKSMQYFRDMVGKDEDADDLLAPALKLASYRVVVKRPRKSPFLNQQKPSFSQEGKANRFDIYVNKSMK